MRLFFGQPRVDDLGVDDDETHAAVLERVEVLAEVALPERQGFLGDHGRRTPGHGLVADVVVAGNEMERAGDRAAELQEPLGGGGAYVGWAGTGLTRSPRWTANAGRAALMAANA